MNEAISFFIKEVDGYEVTFMRIGQNVGWLVKIDGTNYGDFVILQGISNTVNLSEYAEAVKVLMDQAKRTIQELKKNHDH